MTTANRQIARSQAARDNIVQAALTVFALKGYAEASMDDVCMAAGCSKGGLYHHFRTKTAVLYGVVARLAAARALLPAGDDAPLPEPSTGRLLLDIWAETARHIEMQQMVSASCAAAPDALGLERVLRVGAMVQSLALTDEADPSAAARRLGIERAA